MSSASSAQSSSQSLVQQYSKPAMEQTAEAHAGTLQPGVPLPARQLPVSGVTPGWLHSVRFKAVVTQIASQLTSQQ